jgi:hypothetical protein
MNWDRLIGPLLIGLTGLALLGVGLFGLTWGAASFKHEAAAVAALRPLGALELAALPAGSRVLVEGQVSSAAEAGAGGLAAYLVEAAQGDGGDGNEARWQIREMRAPSLELTLADGSVRLINSGYTLLAPPIVVPLAGGAQRLRYRGFAPGSPALAYGSLEFSASGPALRADWLFGGDQAAYLAEQQANLRAVRSVGAIFSLLGLLALGGSTWLGRQLVYPRPR